MLQRCHSLAWAAVHAGWAKGLVSESRFLSVGVTVRVNVCYAHGAGDLVWCRLFRIGTVETEDRTQTRSDEPYIDLRNASRQSQDGFG